jgi:hypothetical protein
MENGLIIINWEQEVCAFFGVIMMYEHKNNVLLFVGLDNKLYKVHSKIKVM